MDSIFNFFTGDDTVDAAAKKSGTSSGMIDNFKTKAKMWAQKVLILYNADVSGSVTLTAEKKSLLKYAKYIKRSIESVFGALDDLEGVNLGLIPLIPVAAILIALAAITKWTTDFLKFNAKLSTYNKLRGDGNTARDASRIVDDILGDKPMFSLGSLPLVIGVGGALFYYFKVIKK